MIRLELPAVPSTNHLYANVSGKGRVKTARYRSWTRAAGNSVLACLATARVRAISGPVEITLGVGAPDNRRRDPDNAIKASLDLLKAHGIIEDDNRKVVRRLVVEPTDRTDLVVEVRAWLPLRGKVAA